MVKATTVVKINKPIPDVFRIVGTDYVKNHRKWDSRNISTETEGPMAKGVRGVEKRKDGGRAMTYNFEVTEFQANERMEFKARGGPVTFGATYAFQPDGDATQLSIEFTMSMGGIMRIIELFMGGGLQKDLTATGVRIKDFVEKQ